MILQFTEMMAEWSNPIMAAASLIVAIVAWRGLTKWKPQFKAREEHELASHLLKTLYEWRDGIDAIRSPFVPAQLIPEEDAPGKSEEQRLFMGTERYFETLYIVCSEARREAYSHLVRAEVLWGPDLRNIFEDIARMDNRLKNTLIDYLTGKNPDSSHADKKASKQMLERNRNILFRGEDDPFGEELNAKIQRVEKLLKPKVKL